MGVIWTVSLFMFNLILLLLLFLGPVITWGMLDSLVFRLMPMLLAVGQVSQTINGEKEKRHKALLADIHPLFQRLIPKFIDLTEFIANLIFINHTKKLQRFESS